MRFAIIPLFAALFCAGCGDKTPTSPSSTASSNAVERFDSIINAGESRFFPFSVGSTGQTSINLASLSPITRPGTLSATMEIGWGKVVKDADGNPASCTLAKVTQAAPSLTSQMSDTLTPATDYCANIADIGGLRESANFSIRISHP